MDINNNQQTNTFIKGMDTDTSDMYMGEGSYRYAENLRVVTDGDSNSGELHIIEGTIKIADRNSDEQLLGLTSIRNYEIEVVKNGNTWSIYRSTISDDNVEDRVLVAGPFEKQIWPDGWDGKTKPLSLVARWESNDNVKLYIANGKTELLSINVAEENQGSNFAQIFQASTKILLPPIATVTDSKGAIIPGVVMLYGYIIYKKRGAASTLSILSHAVVSGIDNITGFAVDENSTNIISVEMPDEVINQYVRLYRICYSKSGLLPRVDIIYDQLCQQKVINDIGQSIQNVSTAEFIATNKLSFVPKNIESKGDYMFAGNILYNQDKIDNQFSMFDARCFSAGSYYIDNEQEIEIGSNASNELLSGIPTENVRNRLFDVATIDYDPQYWLKNSDGYNGHGLCFNWKYTYNQAFLYNFDQYKSEKDTPRTYARNEVYRFGVKLYDEEGRASSVKWIADIKMPDYFNPNGDDSMKPYVSVNGTWRTVNNLSIEFTPIPSELWNNVYKYEIVQAKRGITDSYKIMQGLSGYPTQVGDDTDNEICVPYYLTTQDFYVGRGIVNPIGALFNGSFDWMGFYEEWSYLHSHPAFLYPQDKNQLMFISPEYIYQPDDIKALMSQYKTALSHHTIGIFAQRDIVQEVESYAFNSADEFFGAGKTLDPTLYLKPNDYLTTQDWNADLRIGVHNGGGTKAVGTYYLTSQVMNACNYDARNDGYAARYEPRGGWKWDDGGFKFAFFTNIIPDELLQVPQKNNIPVQKVTCYDAASSEDFARDEKCKVRDKFIVLKNGKKFFDWTNPALLDEHLYSVFAKGNDDDIENAWKQQTMTAYDDLWLSLKYRWVSGSADDDWAANRGRVGQQALSFPTSPGSSGILLETGGDTDTYFESTISGLETPAVNSMYPMPPVTIANLYKSATPYGGYNISAINSTQYVGEGYVASPEEPVVMSMGDNHITMFAFMLYHNFDNAQHDVVTSAALQYIVPIESTMDLSKTCSDYIQATHNSELPVPGDGAWVQVKPSTNAGRFTQTTDMYLYNTAYSVNPDIITYAAEDTVNAADALYDYRVHYSLKKQNNELIDNWTNFKAIDYLDVDSRYGEITTLKLFKDKLIFLQENGAGILSVNDRIILKDQNSANIIVGNGGVLDRFDYFTTMYGLKPDQRAVEVSNDALYWWDGHRKEILSYTDGYNIQLLQRIKNVQDYIDNGEESETPSVLYDVDNKEVLFNVVNNETLVYNEQTQSFTAVYKFSPIYYCNLNGKTIITDRWDNAAGIYEYNKNEDGNVTLFDNSICPTLTYVVNKDSTYNKVFDLQTFGGRFYKGDTTPLEFIYKTPLKQRSELLQRECVEVGEGGLTDREYDYRLAIPRNNNDFYGGRMRGKTMECLISSISNNYDFSIQYVTTKYRMSWT